MSVTELIPQFLVEDLARSGLEPQDVRARLAGPGEKQVTNTPIGVDAYVLPYFDMYGKAIPFYRAKLINNPDPKVKYKQIATSPNHVYFPLGFAAALRGAAYILITEGEKKAAAAVKAGFPCVGLGGTDSWKNRTVVLHKDSQVGTSKSGAIVAKMPAGAEVTERVDTLARGLQEIIDYAIRKRIPIIICFDSDLAVKELIRFEVQRSAATFGYELRHRGVPFNQIKQLILSPVGEFKKDGKLGLDDFLQDEGLGPDELERQLEQVMKARSAFPRHPNPRDYVNRKLQRAALPRGEMQGLGNSIICDLDARGLRLHCPDDDMMYYFDEGSYRLMKVVFSHHLSFSQTPFGIKLYQDYGITSGDIKFVQVLNSQFCAEEPIATVKPEKVLCVRGHALYYQITDGLMVRVDKDDIKILTNGSDDVLFEADLVKPIPHQQLLETIATYKGQTQLDNRWYDTLKDARIKESTNDYQRRLLSLLYSISPYMYKWRGTQLPIEQMLGEAGSGKSTLFSLRQQILTGISVLRNAPNDIRDWTASVAHTGGLHVTDNVHMTNSQLKQALSDELCRIITEPDPHIERRKLYSDNELIRTPVKTVFAVTAIKQPFTNTDIIQRSIVCDLDKGTGDVVYDSDWDTHQLARHGGRIHWVAHQMVFMQRLFQLIDKKWKEGYKARFRLINVEQLLMLASEVYGEDGDWIPSFLETSRDDRTARSDFALEGLIAWADHIRRTNDRRKLPAQLFTTIDMTWFFEADEDFDKNPILINSRSLGNYLADKKNTIAHIAGIVPANYKKSNRWAYRVIELDHS